MTKFDVKCPRCGGLASAAVFPGGVAGTYREPMPRLVARRIACSGCGFIADPDGALPYELWFKVSVRGQTAWAENREQAGILVDYLLDGLRRPRSESERVWIETLPGWVLEPANRRLIAERLRRLLDEG
jgi:hypothetical protein